MSKSKHGQRRRSGLLNNWKADGRAADVVREVGMSKDTIWPRRRNTARRKLLWSSARGKGVETPSLALRAHLSRLKPEMDRMELVVFLRERKQWRANLISRSQSWA
jgi:hypothetical protein